MIQGAPGAGKTALLDVLTTQAKSNGWEVAEIAIEDLYTPASMAQSLGEAYFLNSEFALKAGVTFIEGQVVGHVAGHATPQKILKRLAPETGLILVLDEAQRLYKIPDDSERHTVASSTLEMIHNGKLGKPVILLTAGLGTSETAYGSLGISRFVSKCRVPLGSLSYESTCDVIRDFLVDKGGVNPPPPKWIETIAGQTHGWSQHIVSYADPAANYLASHQTSTDKGLDIVLQQGRAEQIEYYERRAHDIDEELRVTLTRAIKDVPIDGTTTRTVIIDGIKQSGLNEEDADNLFTRALDQGIIDHQKRGRYGIPIPSFHTWLLDEYA
ncbi:MAG: ATP-binding protein [Bacteroidetes bacterium]|nr:ATP-binding protein [Bacteroidota bacterium]